MTVGGFVEYDPAGGTYRLPSEYAASLVRAAGPGNLASFMQDLALLGTVEDKVLDAFRRGGGVPYTAYPRFQELQAEETARVYDAALVDVIHDLARPERALSAVTGACAPRAIRTVRTLRLPGRAESAARTRGRREPTRRATSWPVPMAAVGQCVRAVRSWGTAKSSVKYDVDRAQAGSAADRKRWRGEAEGLFGNGPSGRILGAREPSAGQR